MLFKERELERKRKLHINQEPHIHTNTKNCVNECKCYMYIVLQISIFTHVFIWVYMQGARVCVCVHAFRCMTYIALPLSLPLRRGCPPSQIVPVRPVVAPCGLHTIKSYDDMGRKYLWNMSAWQCSIIIAILGHLDVSGM